MTKNELQTIRLWNPLFPKTYERDRDGHVASYPTKLSTVEIVPYLEKILATIDKQRIKEEGDRGLAVYLGDEILQRKIFSIHPSVEEWDGRLWGITEVQIYQALEKEEQEELIRELETQLSDGWGEEMEQCPIATPEGELYLSFWSSDGTFFIKPEDEMLREFSENAEIGLK